MGNSQQRCNTQSGIANKKKARFGTKNPLSLFKFVITCQKTLHKIKKVVDMSFSNCYSVKVIERRTKMKEKELRRSMSVFPIGTVIKLTDLSARQIRYYEEQDLIHPQRSEGNRRMYSLNDIDVLLEIKDYLAEGINMAGIKRIYELQEKEKEEKSKQSEKTLTDDDVRKILYSEFLSISGLSPKDKNKLMNNPFRNQH